ncbi:alkaline ceramidase [Blastomyces dermatitidis ER-3]|uniref:Neutral ceramidase n=2 Tax=Blastomyces TaxID=229219 RepID=A0A179UEU4_BLAGS|nr:alkaline ceramidase [Blastomyces gilchristii SLH14081]XP_045275151.1 alkaline ceramidase [Blastomyces dermatitidis ER-3]EEQ87912.2 alkaline ceramidase [Blastomyces dermatitidis ER-3]OAT06273.1 alkaline ceramidase [Blastomyces gilchristii SLH14081]
MAPGGILAGLLGSLACVLVLLHFVFVVEDTQPSPWYSSKTSAYSGRSRQSNGEDDVFLLGTGKADITGPVVELNLMGYADINQVGTGLRQRIYSRAFIVGSTKNPDERFVYLVLDNAMGDTAIRQGILDGLRALGGEYTRYGKMNVAVTGTHSHAGPGAWLNYLLPQITSLGFDKQSYRAIVDGALLSIKRAHENLAPGRLSFGSIEVEDGAINRSPSAYIANPEEEKKRYNSDVDKTLTLLKFDRIADQKTIGILTFYPVHGTSLFGNNTLIAGDNKGVAAYLFERSVQDDAKYADDFVAGFSQSNVGDTSPNTLGAWCEDGSGLPCTFKESTCGGKTTACHGRGPYFREMDQGAKSCFENGRRQYAAAKDLVAKMNSTAVTIRGADNVAAFHTFQDFSNFTFTSPLDPSRGNLNTCYASLGFSFAAGTTDGPGVFDFTQNATDGSTKNPFWYVARDLLHAPSKEQKKCQEPKIILLDVGGSKLPYAWSPNIVDVQLFRVGQMVIIVSPGEASTMAGRRWKEAISKSATDVLGISDPITVLGGPANTYVHYITTEEEYGVQRYEGASTLHGPHTLAAHMNLTLTYLPYLKDSPSRKKLPPFPAGPSPPIHTDISYSFITPVIHDTTPIQKKFGDAISSPDKSKAYKPGDTVRTKFIGANPRNNLRLEGTYTAVEYSAPGSRSWEVVRDDFDWTLVYHWKRINPVLGTSEVTVEWLIDDEFYSVGNPRKLKSGTYRMRYFGDWKKINGEITQFEGIGETFQVQV